MWLLRLYDKATEYEGKCNATFGRYRSEVGLTQESQELRRELIYLRKLVLVLFEFFIRSGFKVVRSEKTCFTLMAHVAKSIHK